MGAGGQFRTKRAVRDIPSCGRGLYGLCEVSGSCAWRLANGSSTTRRRKPLVSGNRSSLLDVSPARCRRGGIYILGLLTVVLLRRLFLPVSVSHRWLCCLHLRSSPLIHASSPPPEEDDGDDDTLLVGEIRAVVFAVFFWWILAAEEAIDQLRLWLDRWGEGGCN